MPSKETSFFSTREELVEIVSKIIGLRNLQVVLAGNFNIGVPTHLESGEELQPFQRYLVVNNGKGVSVEEIQLRAGGKVYVIDQLHNKDSCIIHVGGFAREDQLIAGKVNTLGESKEAVALYDIFAKAFRKSFAKIKSFYVSPRAELMLDSGKRLSQNENAPVAYDLAR